jgi:hypothetical protein
MTLDGCAELRSGLLADLIGCRCSWASPSLLQELRSMPLLPYVAHKYSRCFA